MKIETFTGIKSRKFCPNWRLWQVLVSSVIKVNLWLGFFIAEFVSSLLSFTFISVVMFIMLVNAGFYIYSKNTFTGKLFSYLHGCRVPPEHMEILSTVKYFSDETLNHWRSFSHNNVSMSATVISFMSNHPQLLQRRLRNCLAYFDEACFLWPPPTLNTPM